MDIKDIAKKVGGVVALSKALGLSRGAVSQWRVVPSDRVLTVCALAEWRVSPHELRPDLYPNPNDALPTPGIEQEPGLSFSEYPAAMRAGDRRQDDRRDGCDADHPDGAKAA